MADQQTYSQAYLLGIRDERQLMRDLIAHGHDIALEAPAMLARCKEAMRGGWTGDMADYMRGSLDFWRNQCGKLATKGARHDQAN